MKSSGYFETGPGLIIFTGTADPPRVPGFEWESTAAVAPAPTPVKLAATLEGRGWPDNP